MNGFQIGLAALIFAAALLFGGLWAFQTFGIYRFDQSRQSPEAFGLGQVQVVAFTSEDGAPAQAWLSLPASGRPVLFSFHGNSAGIGPSMQRLAPLIADGTGVVMLQYRGAGGTAGHASEENFARDARALYDQLDTLAGQTIPQNRRALHGFSLGAGVGSRLAAERPFGAVVLEASFPRACEYYRKRYFGFPLCALMWAERFDIIDRIGAITAPKLFVHGTEDRSIPLSWGQRLFVASPEPKSFVALPGGGHSDLARYGLIEAMQGFLREQIK
jgi:uncharacterized protein